MYIKYMEKYFNFMQRLWPLHNFSPPGCCASQLPKLLSLSYSSLFWDVLVLFIFQDLWAPCPSARVPYRRELSYFGVRVVIIMPCYLRPTWATLRYFLGASRRHEIGYPKGQGDLWREVSGIQWVSCGPWGEKPTIFWKTGSIIRAYILSTGWLIHTMETFTSIPMVLCGQLVT